MTPEQQAQAPEIPEEFRPLALSLIGHPDPQAGSTQLYRARHGSAAAQHSTDG
jgi:hypothetical protein